MMRKGVRDIAADAAAEVCETAYRDIGGQGDVRVFLTDVENESGLLIQREQEGSFGFAHHAFQEYLAAAQLAKEQNNEQRDALLRENLLIAWWEETTLLYAAQRDATDLIVPCLDSDPPSIGKVTFALRCVGEALGVDQSIRSRLETLLFDNLESSDEESRRVAAEILLAMRLREPRVDRFPGFQTIDETTEIDGTFISHAEYQLFLDDMTAHGKSHHPYHWTADRTRFDQGEALSPVVGIGWSDAEAFCDWLTERSNGSARYRLPDADELSGHSSLRSEDLHRSFQGLVASSVHSWNPSGEVFGYDDARTRYRGRTWRVTPALVETTHDAWNRARDLALALDFDRVL
ncbi:hypothetical protein FJZ36_10350, partial [Candidatus Poribacteria bacterium]|nr:hypothetical protein [Candidatus Poribacteria bacterium]